MRADPRSRMEVPGSFKDLRGVPTTHYAIRRSTHYFPPVKQVNINARGSDAKDAADALAHLVESGFEEEDLPGY